MLPENSFAPPAVSCPLGPSSRNDLEVPNSSSPVLGSNVMESQAVPPPCCHDCGPDQVFAAISSALLSNPLAGSPGTVQNRHSSLPVSASNAAIDPRIC